MNPTQDPVQEFIGQLSRYASPDTHIGRISDGTDGRGAFSIFTAVNEYRISYRRPTDVTEGYLGCVATSRTPRAGEDWRRGNDLHDGPFSSETWHRILADIVSYEMVRVSQSAQTQNGPATVSPAQ